MPEPVKITILSDPSYIGVVRTAVETFGGRHGFSRDQLDQIGLAVNEALANVIKHAYNGNMTQLIHIALDVIHLEGVDLKAMKVLIRDYGRQVDPSSIKSRDLEDVRPGGLGVHIIRTVMDEVEYRPAAGGGMELTMLKYLPMVKEVVR